MSGTTAESMLDGRPSVGLGPATADLTDDRLLGGRVVLHQPRHGYRAAIDPVLLAAAVPARVGERVLDVGAGAGAAGLCLAARLPGVVVTGIEVDPALAALANANAEAGGMAGRVEVLTGDIAGSPAPIAAEARFDHVLTNPPFLEPERADRSPDPGKDRAHVEGSADLALWLDYCLARLRYRGSLTVIHRADRLDALLAHLHARRRDPVGGITVFPLWPKGDGRPAKRVIVQARKAGRAPTVVMSGLILHESDGQFTAAADAVLSDAAALRLSPVVAGEDGFQSDDEGRVTP